MAPEPDAQVGTEAETCSPGQILSNSLTSFQGAEGVFPQVESQRKCDVWQGTQRVGEGFLLS